MDSTERLFLALWPDEATRVALDGARAGLKWNGGRLVAARNLHVTLVFLGATNRVRRACVEQACERVGASVFELIFQHVEWKSRTGIAWIAAPAVPTGLHDLLASLHAGLAGCDHVAEARPFRPHVTLWRDLTRGERQRQITPIRWSV